MTQLIDVQDIVAGRHKDPFSILGLHQDNGNFVIRAFIPEAHKIDVMDDKTGYKIVGLKPATGGDDVKGFFEAVVPRRHKKFTYRLNVKQGDLTWMTDDPYQFGQVLTRHDESLIFQGKHWNLWQALGAHTITHEGVWGTHFAVWAPNARRVSVVGNFNIWDGRRHVMRSCSQSGVWEIFIPRLTGGEAYKFEILEWNGRVLPQKADPVGFGAEHPPETSSIVRDFIPRDWADQAWMTKRNSLQQADQPISIYEVNISSWQRVEDDFNRRLTYTELAKKLINYVQNMGFTHIEIMPISEFPYNDSWGYQPVGLFAPTARHGNLEEFRALVEACHLADMGLILNWAASHIPDDEHGLNRFDGSNLYQNSAPTIGYDPLRKTSQFNYENPQVQNFLIANALYWAKEYHIDALRIDGLSALIYHEHSRQNGNWLPIIKPANQNPQALAFLSKLNDVLATEMSDLITMAEDISAYKGISKPTAEQGLGFDFTWNVRWANDSLQFMCEEPEHRKFHYHKMTIDLNEAQSENYILPLGHNQVAQGEGSLLSKMPGEMSQKFANLRAYYGFMWGHPGKKLMFMGCEFAQASEWDHSQGLNWDLLEQDEHEGVQALVRDLNKLYKTTPALYQQDNATKGFEWTPNNSPENSLYVWMRHGFNAEIPIIVVSNLSPNEHQQTQISVPVAGDWVERLNTDAKIYGGQGRENQGVLTSQPNEDAEPKNSITLNLPPLTTIFLQPRR